MRKIGSQRWIQEADLDNILLLNEDYHKQRAVFPMSYGKGKAVFLLLSVDCLAAKTADCKSVTRETPKVRVLLHGFCSHGVIGRRMRFKPAFRKEYEFKSRWEHDKPLWTNGRVTALRMLG